MTLEQDKLQMWSFKSKPFGFKSGTCYFYPDTHGKKQRKIYHIYKCKFYKNILSSEYGRISQCQSHTISLFDRKDPARYHHTAYFFEREH